MEICKCIFVHFFWENAAEKVNTMTQMVGSKYRLSILR